MDLVHNNAVNAGVTATMIALRNKKDHDSEPNLFLSFLLWFLIVVCIILPVIHYINYIRKR